MGNQVEGFMTKTVSDLLDLLFGVPPKLRRRRAVAR
jgi:hypothetical protein